MCFNLRKFIKIIAVLVVFAFTPLQVTAIAVSPSTGNYGVGSVITFNIIAKSVPSGAEGAKIRFNLSTGAEITGYTPPTGSGWSGLAAPGGCNALENFSSSSLCPDVVKSSGTIAENESLGSVVIRFNSAGTVSFSKTSANAYLVGSDLIPDSSAGNGVYSILTSLPATSIFDSIPSELLILFLGSTLIITGMRVYKKGKEFRNQTN